MIILLLLILFFIYSNVDNKYKLWGFMIATALILIIHEIYMSIGLQRIENFNNYLSSETNLTNKQGTLFSQLGYNLILPELEKNNLDTFNVFTNIQKIIDIVPVKSNNEIILYNNLLNQNSSLIHFFNNELVFSNSSILDDPSVGDQIPQRYFMSAESLDTSVIYAGGTGLSDQDSISDNISVYDTYWKVYSQTTLNKPRYNMSSYSNDEMVLFAFGINEEREISKTIDIYFYDNGTKSPSDKKSWSTLKCPYPGRLYTKIEYYQNTLMFIGGYDGDKFTKTIITYDMKNEKWNQVNIPSELLESNLDVAILKDSRENISDKLFILSSPNYQSKYLHQNLVYTILDKPYIVKHENSNVIFEVDSSSQVSYKDVDSDDDQNKINYNYLGDYIPSLYEKLSSNTNDEYTISMWLYVDIQNKDKTRIIMGDYDLCTGETGSLDANEYNALILHKNKLMPCFKLQKKILIKNNDELPEVEFNKWIHVVYSIHKDFKNEVIETLNNTITIETDENNNSTCVFTKNIEEHIEDLPDVTTTLAPQTIDNNIKINHKVNTYINGVKHVSNMNFELKYDIDKNGLVISGFDVFDDERKYAQKTMMSNFKIFNNNINYGTIIDIYRNEYSMYLENIIPKLYYYDFNTKDFKNANLGLKGFNGIMESFHNEQLVISLTNKENITNYSKYNNYTNEFELIKDLNTNNVNIGAIELENSVVFYNINNNIVKFHKIPMETTLEKDIINCPIGSYVEPELKKCEMCPENTFSKIKNAKKCTNCPYGMSTQGKIGQSKCVITDEFKNKVIHKPLDKNFETIIETQNQIYESTKEKIDINNENIKALDNNFTLLTKKM